MIIKNLGLCDYEPIWQAMQAFTLARQPDTPDEIWLLQHPPIYTLGLAGKPEHLLEPSAIPVIKIDRGGQITYHGPGQLIVYLLLDMKRHHLGVRELVRKMEQAVIKLLADYGIVAEGRVEAPGVYVNEAKIAALGLRIRKGCCYHGLSLNVEMDLTPFNSINPCGYPDLAVTQLRDLGVNAPMDSIEKKLVEHLLRTIVLTVE